MKKRFKHSWFGRTGCPTRLAKARQISLLGRAQKAAAAPGCPIEFEQAAEFPMLPERGADQGKESGETVWPLSQISAEAQEHIGQQCRPHLPLGGALVWPRKSASWRVCLSSLKKDSMDQRQRYKSAMVCGLQARWLVRKVISRSWPSTSTIALTRRSAVYENYEPTNRAMSQAVNLQVAGSP